MKSHNSLQSADKDQQEMRAVAEKPQVAVSKCKAASRDHPCDSVASCFCFLVCVANVINSRAARPPLGGYCPRQVIEKQLS